MRSTIWLANSARSEMLKHRSDSFPLETGGILLGYSTEENNQNHWVVTSVTGPGESAKHGKYRFTPDDKYHISEAKRHYYQTSGTEYYLGDWHTHPDGSCVTSFLDRMTLYRNARRAHYLRLKSLMIIVGGAPGTTSYGAYIGNGGGGLFKSLVSNQPLDLRFFS